MPARGTITLPAAANPSESWDLQFERLRFDVPSLDGRGTVGSGAGGAASEDHAPSSLGSLADPHSIPAINFHAVDLTAGERHFGDVQATLLKLDDGISLEHVTVTNPSFSISAQGELAVAAARDRVASWVRFLDRGNDVQNTLQQLGYAEVIQAKTGRMDFDLHWDGAPTADALSGATGHVQLSLDKGQIVGLNPGAGRVLGLASVAALPRRLALDFSDLTDKGLAFDTVHGDFDLRDGNAYTENVLVKGPAAEILSLIGRVGLKTSVISDQPQR